MLRRAATSRAATARTATARTATARTATARARPAERLGLPARRYLHGSFPIAT